MYQLVLRFDPGIISMDSSCNVSSSSLTHNLRALLLACPQRKLPAMAWTALLIHNNGTWMWEA